MLPEVKWEVEQSEQSVEENVLPVESREEGQIEHVGQELGQPGPERDVDVHRVLLTPTFDRLRLQSAGQAWQVGQLDHFPKRYRVEDCLRDAEQDNVEEVFRADAHRVLGQSEEEHDSANVRIIQRPVQCLFTSWWTRAATYRQCVNNIYLNGQIPASFCLFSSFSH